MNCFRIITSCNCGRARLETECRCPRHITGPPCANMRTTSTAMRAPSDVMCDSCSLFASRQFRLGSTGSQVQMRVVVPEIGDGNQGTARGEREEDEGEQAWEASLSLLPASVVESATLALRSTSNPLSVVDEVISHELSSVREAEGTTTVRPAVAVDSTSSPVTVLTSEGAGQATSRTDSVFLDVVPDLDEVIVETEVVNGEEVTTTRVVHRPQLVRTSTRDGGLRRRFLAGE
ncbi:Hypothetical protein D9617_23g004760 [Elsinoe fawcettii]|nr:Hypothetical protein D9617_23g004760 [Elsinoe fawcettii]